MERSLLRDGFVLKRRGAGSGRFYSHEDGRQTVIHFHHGHDTFARKTLASILAAARWTEDDARRLGLLD